MIRAMRPGFWFLVLYLLAPSSVFAQTDTTLAHLLRSVSDPEKRTQWRQAVAGLTHKPDSETIELWKEVIAKDDLNSLPNGLFPLGPPQRSDPVEVHQSQKPIPRPIISSQVIGDVRPYSKKRLPTYQGRFVVTELDSDHISGILANHPEQLDLIYRLPEHKIVQTRINDTLLLSLRDYTEEFSLRREVLLQTRRGKPILFYLSDGGPGSYHGRFPSLPDTIRVSQSNPRGIDSVRVSVSGDARVLRPGQRSGMKWGVNELLELRILASVAGQSSGLVRDGDAYHLALILYAVSDTNFVHVGVP